MLKDLRTLEEPQGTDPAGTRRRAKDLAALTSLTTLDLTDSNKLTDKGLKELTALKNLTNSPQCARHDTEPGYWSFNRPGLAEVPNQPVNHNPRSRWS